jgi:hypothetical protein
MARADFRTPGPIIDAVATGFKQTLNAISGPNLTLALSTPRSRLYCGPVLRHPAEPMLPADDLGGRVWLGGKPRKGGPAAPAFGRLTALTGLAGYEPT